MKRMRFACAVVGVAISAQIACAQQSEGPITWVRHFTVELEHSEQFVELIKEIDSPIFDAMLADGSVLSWGIFEPFVREAGGYTHGLWVTAPNWGEIDDMMNRFERLHAQESEGEGKAIMAKFASMMDTNAVYDRVFRQLIEPPTDTAPSGAETQYFSLAFLTNNAGPFYDGKLIDLHQKLRQPALDQLRAEGVILGSGLARQEFVTTTEYTHVAWMTYPNLAAIDRVRQTFAQIEAERSATEQLQVEREVNQVIEFPAFRSTIFRVLHNGGT